MSYLHRTTGQRSGRQHEIATTPLFTLQAKHIAEGEDESSGSDDQTSSRSSENTSLPQYGLLGFNVGHATNVDMHEPIMLNTNAPNSVFICGSQGSGKSYTLACMLEGLLRPQASPGKAGNPVAGVVFNYDMDSSGSVSEAAHLCSLGVPVDVLVSKSNEHVLRKASPKN